MIPWTFKYFKILVGPALLLNVFLLIFYHEPQTIKNYLLFITVIISGFLIEVFGVKTSLIFGSYEYGKVLGPKLFDTPLLIGFNWLMLTYCCSILVSNIKLNTILKALTGAVFMTLYDFIMEPAAIWLDFWNWKSMTIPIRNYVGWFTVSLIFTVLFLSLAKHTKNKIAPALFIAQTVFFLFLSLRISLFQT